MIVKAGGYNVTDNKVDTIYGFGVLMFRDKSNLTRPFAIANVVNANATIANVTIALLVFLSSSAWGQSDTQQQKQPPKTDVVEVNTNDASLLPIDPSDANNQFLFNGEAPTTLEQLRSMEKRFDQLSKKLMPATVNIQLLGGPNGASQGSGVVVTSDGYVLTAAHVIGEPNQTAYVVFPDGERLEAETLGVNDGSIDSGMIKIKNPKNRSFPYIDLGISQDLKIGQWVMAIGHPGGFDDKRGLVTRVGRIVAKTTDVIKTDCTLVGGDSGGPLIDMNGELVGIHSRIGLRLSDNYHVPVDQFSDNWDKMADGLILNGRPTLGFGVVGSSNVIDSVKEGQPADKAGLKPGDVVVSIEGQSVEDRAGLSRAIKELKLLPNQQIEIKAKRNDEEKSFTLKVGQR
jgi:serine protease Do